MGASQPFLYAGQPEGNSKFPTAIFDPKAITRASWEPKPKKPRPKGPLLSFNRHPDTHLVFQHRTGHYAPLGRRSKGCIKWLRRLQLFLRLLQLNGAVGVLVIYSLFSGVDEGISWALRILQGISILHCAYAIYHLSRDAAGRTPASSAAYQYAASVVDLVSIAAYTFGALTVHKESDHWGIIINDQTLMYFFTLAVSYASISTGGLHAFSGCISLWLGWVFRKISLMPPDMNPLEDHLTARPFHKRNKSSLSEAGTVLEADHKRFTSLKANCATMVLSDNTSTRPIVPFMHTREQSCGSTASEKLAVNLPSRQYQAIALSTSKIPTYIRPPHRASPKLGQHNSYTEMPLKEQSSSIQSDVRAAKFTESWMPTESLTSRTNQRAHFMPKTENEYKRQMQKPYLVLTQQDSSADLSSDSDYEVEVGGRYDGLRDGLADTSHPNPLGSNPASPAQETNKEPSAGGVARISNKITRGAMLYFSRNSQHETLSNDIADEHLRSEVSSVSRLRDCSIQRDDYFYSKAYGEIKPATPPILVGSNRKVSSGNDFQSKHSAVPYGRRNASGKMAEEGRADRRMLSSQA